MFLHCNSEIQRQESETLSLSDNGVSQNLQRVRMIEKEGECRGGNLDLLESFEL